MKGDLFVEENVSAQPAPAAATVAAVAGETPTISVVAPTKPAVVVKGFQVNKTDSAGTYKGLKLYTIGLSAFIENTIQVIIINTCQSRLFR